MRWGAPTPVVPKAVEAGHVNYGGQSLQAAPLVSSDRPVAHNGQLLQPQVVEQQQALAAEASAADGKDNALAKAEAKAKEMKVKAQADQGKQQVAMLSSALKRATSPVFAQPTGAGNAPALRAPSVPKFNFFDAKKNPVLAQGYEVFRNMALQPLLNRYTYGGFQGSLANKAWHPIVQNQLEAGPGRYQPGMMDQINRSGLMGLLGPAQKYLTGLIGGGTVG